MNKKTIKKLVGLILIAGVCALICHPAITLSVGIYMIVKAVELIITWWLLNIVSLLLFHKTVLKFIFDDDN